MNDKITVIGAGMMGSAIIKSLIKGNYGGKITAVDIAPEKLKDLEKLRRKNYLRQPKSRCRCRHSFHHR